MSQKGEVLTNVPSKLHSIVRKILPHEQKDSNIKVVSCIHLTIV